MIDVSCMMVTIPGREDLARLSVESFKRQTYKDAVLVILNQGGERITKADPNIREVVVPRLPTTGQARNACLDLCDTEFVIHWDDDDQHGMNRLALQVGQLKQTGKPNMLLHFMLGDIATGESYITTNPTGNVGTLCAKLEDVQRFRYGESTIHEENQVVNGLKTLYYDDIDLIDNPTDTYLRWYHGSNSCTRQHVFDIAGKIKRELTMRENWYFRAVHAYWTAMQRPVQCDCLESIYGQLKGVPFMTYAKAKWLLEFFSNRPSTRALEIGTCHGVGAAYLSLMFSNVDTLDIESSLLRTPNVWDTIYAIERYNINVMLRDPRDHRIPGDHLYDLVFVDGPHTRRDCGEDVNESRKRLTQNGVIILDDLNHPTATGPREVYEEQTCKKFEYEGWGVLL